jgi:hypothetical protein
VSTTRQSFALKAPVRIAILAVVVLALVAVLGGCAGRTVSVQTGERVICTYGETVSTTVHTVRVPASEAKKYSVTTRTITCDRHTQLEKLYAEAQAALGKNDLATAKSKLEAVVKLEATYKKAAAQLEEIASGKTPAPDGSTGASTSGGGTPPDTGGESEPGTVEGPVASLLVYTPDSIEGFTAQPVIADAYSISRQYLPKSSGGVASLVIVAEQFRDATAAQDWIETNVRGRYVKSARDVKVGSRNAYLGTDGRRFAVIGWTEGPIAIAVEADAGNEPAGAFSLLQTVAADIVH